MRPPPPFEQPTYRPDLPIYPHLLQLLLVSEVTVAGPSGQLLYTATTQQVRDSTLLPRSREPCLVFEPNGTLLQAGYYLGRLCSSYSGIPVYSVISPSDAGLMLPGITVEQWELLTSNLTQTQINNLNNLDACQLQILLTTLNITQISTLTSSAVPQQIQNLVVTTPPTVPGGPGQSSTLTLITTLTTHQILQLTTAIPDEKLTELVTTIPVNLIQKLIDTLPIPELSRVVTVLPIPQLYNLLTSTTNDQLTNIVQTLTTPQLDRVTKVSQQQLTDLATTLTPNQILTLTQLLTNSQFQTLLDQFTISTIQELLTTLTYDEFNTLVTTVPNLTQIALMLQVVTIPTLQTLIQTLTQPQLTTLVNYPVPTIDKLVDLPIAELELVLDRAPPAPVLGNQLQPPMLPFVVGQPSSTPVALEGYATTVVDQNTGDTYNYVGGAWHQVGGGGGGGSGARTEGTLAATGNSQGTAAAIITDTVTVSGADGTKGVILPNTPAGIIHVSNDSGSTQNLLVYPPSGARIGTGSLNAADTLSDKTTAIYYRLTSTQWIVLPGAAIV